MVTACSDEEILLGRKGTLDCPCVETPVFVVNVDGALSRGTVYALDQCPGGGSGADPVGANSAELIAAVASDSNAAV